MVARNGCSIDASVSLRIDAARSGTESDRAGNLVSAPLHGLVSKIFVAVGDSVAEGAPVAQMEAMKLVHTLPAPVSGTVARIRHAPGETVGSGTILIEITPAAAEEKS